MHTSSEHQEMINWDVAPLRWSKSLCFHMRKYFGLRRPCGFTLSAVCFQEDVNKLLRQTEVSTSALHFWVKETKKWESVDKWKELKDISRCRCLLPYTTQYLFQFLSPKEVGFLLSCLASRWGWFLDIICGRYRPKPAAAVTAENGSWAISPLTAGGRAEQTAAVTERHFRQRGRLCF